ncbi:DNA helicase [Empedobacter brevis NBRC 14943 = ATCC 43319]|uniref:DNA helicase n=1 Tax=Empedobacter brevis NBRC 14943 = ATCC 43319 TaxID=1218108 RepID=A0A511NGP6_9FLAO|nr:ATP-dependent helicase [Empedobacter brevis]GEM51837.1 DNA helicase [Empedobacter brevis NBRC 14943 = ATCC 43319]
MGAIEEIVSCIDSKQSYVLEAGAGSGKTYSLIQTLRYVIEKRGAELELNGQKIICITYTNVAKNEIIKRIEYNDLVNVYTIHEFLWQSIKQFQKQLKVELCKLNEVRLASDKSNSKDSKYLENLSARVENIDNVIYDDSSFRDFEKGELHHDDVIDLAKMIFENYNLITSITAQKYPYIFIDEYQDTSEETIKLLIDDLLIPNSSRIVLGFYGDSHQKIYDNGIGDLEEYYERELPILQLIKKEENYRSSKSVVHLLNNFRTNIQQVSKKEIDGTVRFLYWANHPEKPKKGITEFNNGLKAIKNKYYDDAIIKLKLENWNFESNSKDKILVLANSRIADRGGFSNLYSIFSKRSSLAVKENLLDRNHILIKLFCGYVDKKSSQERKVGLEHLLNYWTEGNQNEVIRFIKKNGLFLNEFKHNKKKEVSDFLNDLAINRDKKTVKDILDSLLEKEIIFSKNYNDFVIRTNQELEGLDEEKTNRIEKDKTLFNSFLALPYKEILNFWKHIQNQTVFSTKHGTKGDEYRNVLTVIDDTEWVAKYNFNNFFSDVDQNEDRKTLTRNLFYVECSRAKENLVVLMLSKLTDESLAVIQNWFGEENVNDIEQYLEN